MPDKDGGNSKGTPTYNYDLGDGQVVNLVEGLSADELAEIEEALATDETVQEGGENAVTESEKAKEAKEEPVSEVPREEPKEEVKPPEEAPPPPELKFKIKRHGQEIDLDLTADQERLKTLVQLGYDYTVKTQELSREKAYVDAHKQILESESFQQFLQGERSEGRFLPEAAPQVDKAALTEYALRKLDTDFDMVRERMAAIAVSLGPEVEQVVNGDHAAFVRMYDRVANDVRKTSLPPPPQQESPPKLLDAKVQERILKSKEVLKEKAVVETPGGGQEEDLELVRWQKRDAQLAARFKKSQTDEDAVALVMHRQYMPDR
jgi:hypothetical protein